MIPLGGKLDMENKKLELKKVGKEISLIKSPGGHFLIPVKSVSSLNYIPEHRDTTELRNIKGLEADAVMLVMLANTEDFNDIEALHFL